MESDKRDKCLIEYVVLKIVLTVLTYVSVMCTNTCVYNTCNNRLTRKKNKK